MSPTVCHQEQEQDPHQLHPSQPNPRESRQHKSPWSRVGREPPPGETHPVNCCKIQQSECLCIQEPEGIPSCCPHTPVLEYASMAWDVPKQHLKSTLVMVQRRSARRILHDFSPTTSASALVAQLQLENLQSGRTSDKVCMMYDLMNGLVNVNSAAKKLTLKIPISSIKCIRRMKDH